MAFQLRRIGLPPSMEKVKNIFRITSEITNIGRGSTADFYLDSNIRKGLISRCHAKIIKKESHAGTVFEIVDNSTNGTYINDVKVNKSAIMKEGDKIAFGHLRGFLIKPGEIAPQTESEFIFLFERCQHPEIKGEYVEVDLRDEGIMNAQSSVFMSPASADLHHEANDLEVVLGGVAENSSFHGSGKVNGIGRFNGKKDDDLSNHNWNFTDEVVNRNSNKEHDQSFNIGGTYIPGTETQLLHINSKLKTASDETKFVTTCMSTDMKNAEANVKYQENHDVHSSKNVRDREVKEKIKLKNRDDIRFSTKSDQNSYTNNLPEDAFYDSEKSEEITDDSDDSDLSVSNCHSLQKKKTLSNKKRKKSISADESQKTSSKKSKETSRIGRKVFSTQTLKSIVNTGYTNKYSKVRKRRRCVKLDENIFILEDKNKTKKRNRSFVHDPCDAYDCKVPSGNIKKVTWVQCDDCDRWYHVSCSGISVKDAKNENTKFHCGCY